MTTTRTKLLSKFTCHLLVASINATVCYIQVGTTIIFNIIITSLVRSAPKQVVLVVKSRIPAFFQKNRPLVLFSILFLIL